VDLPAPGLGHDLLAREQRQLDADSRESDALPARLRGGGKIVIAAQVPARHARAVVHDRQAGGRGIRRDLYQVGAGVQRIGEYFGEDGLLDGAGIRVPQVLEEVQQVNAGFGHGLSRLRAIRTRNADWDIPTR
jgi:hypothetical protein